MTLYALKPRFQALLRPAAGALARAGVTANQVTVAAAALSVAVGTTVALRLPDTHAFLLIPAWLAVRMALNALDGMLAREHGQRSRLGAYLNELCDVVSDVALVLPFAWLAPFSAGWTVATIVLAILAEYAGAIGPLAGASRRYDGPMGKSDRALVFGALALWAGLAPLPAWLAWAMPAVATLCAVTLVNRVRGGLGEGGAAR
jgi:CDP-diacylglycerol--glycerol-3-phosphate 3-phosphatidyltransferase